MSDKIEHQDQVMTAYLEGEIDHHSARPIREQIDDEAQQSKPQMLLLDFGRVSFMDSSGIGLVMGRFRLMSELGGTLKVVNTPPHIAKVMRLAGMERLNVLEKENGR